MKWKAPLPRALPETGQAHFVFALKDSAGARVELSGTLDAATLAPILGELIMATGMKTGEKPKTN